MSQVTRILDSITQGDSKAAEQLLPLVYDELRKLAAHKMASQPPGQTLQPTALVHEAWLRLVGGEEATFANRAHFFAAAVQAMRHILNANARRKQSQKHGGGWERVEVEHLQLAEPLPPEELLALDEALKELARLDPPAAELVQLRFFGGLSQQQAAEVLGGNDIYDPIYPSINHYDVAAAVLEIPTGSTTDHMAALSAYVKNDVAVSGGVRNGVGFFMAGMWTVNDSAVWGINTLLQDAATRTTHAGTGRTQIGAELDFNVMGAGSSIIGMSVGGNSLAQPTNANAYLINQLGGSGIKWTGGLVSFAGSCDSFIVCDLAATPAAPEKHAELPGLGIRASGYCST